MRDLLTCVRTKLGTCGRIVAVAIACAMALATAAALPRPAEAATGQQKMYRLYNHWSHEHLITSNNAEKVSRVVEGWNYEGLAWNAPTSGKDVYRLRNIYTNEHLYTADSHEYALLDGHGWDGEGVVSHSAAETGYPVYRLYNRWADPVAQHLYTKDANEVSVLERNGYQNEGAKWYASREAGDQDLALGAFFVDVPGGYETVLCTTNDGYNFTKVSTPFKSNENPFHDPSIMYDEANGCFYLLTSRRVGDGNFYPMISYSTDLRTWSEPEGGSLINEGTGYSGIPLPADRYGNDVVAPEWFVDDDGDTYIVFSAGIYGEWHGDAENDRMKPYAVQVSVSNDGLASGIGQYGKHFPKGLKLEYGDVFEIQGLEPSDNYIDGSMYEENGTYYLLIKKNGVTNQIYKNTHLGPTGWQKVQDIPATGNEGPSLVKFDGAYLLYTDQIQTSHGKTGIQMSMASGPTQRFSAPQDIQCSTTLRHGTVIPLTGAAKDIVQGL